MTYTRKYLVISILFILFWICYGSFTNPDAYLTVEELLHKNGYPFEEHFVTTPDNYILKLFRISHGRNSSQPNKSPIYILHGLFGTSDNFLLGGPKFSVAYRMADNGFDVWLGNGRGSHYSRNHTTLNPDTDKEFWQFSWHEIGAIDVPTQIDYILEKTKQTKVFTLGQSQGATCLILTAAFRPEYNEKIALIAMYGQSVYGQNIGNPIIQIPARFHRFLEALGEYLNIHEIIPNIRSLQEILRDVCGQSKQMAVICYQLLLITGGYGNQHNTDINIVQVALSKVGGASVKQGIHFLQTIISGKFRQYDFGVHKNRQVYNRSTPPEYNLQNVKVPVAVFYGNLDMLTSPSDTRKLIKVLPNVALDCPIAHYNHYDLLITKDVVEHVQKPLIRLMKSIEKTFN